MSYNGSGTFVINTAGQPVVSGTVISSTAFNALTADLATGLSTAITKDGQTTPTANIPMGNNKITNLAVGTAATDAANLSQVQSTTAKLVNSISGADTITGTMSPTLGAYATGQMFYFIAAGDNTGAVTLNIDSLGAKAVTRDGTTALAAGDIQSGEMCVVVYDGTRFQLVNGASQSASIVTENLTVNKATVLNESGGDNDTRIEGDTDANLFFVDASTDRVGVGTNTPGEKLSVSTASSNCKVRTDSGSNQVYMGWDGADSIAEVATNGAWRVRVGGSFTEALRVTTGGNLGLGVTPSGNYTLQSQINYNSGFKGFNLGGVSGGTSANGYPAIGYNTRFTSTGDSYVYNDADFANLIAFKNGQFQFLNAASGTAGNAITFTQAMTLDASGNLGVGTSSPLNRLTVSGANTAARGQITVVGASADSRITFYRDSTFNAAIGSGNSDSYIGTESNTPFRFITNGSERARITAGGNLLVGTTVDNGKLCVGGTSSDFRASSGGYVVNIIAENASGANPSIEFTCPGSNAGNIKYSRNNDRFEVIAGGAGGVYLNQSGTSWQSLSDERQKTDLQPIEDAANKVSQLRAVTGRYVWDDESKSRAFLIAQDVQAVLPQAVDAAKEDGTLGLSYTDTIPLLVAAIKEQQAMIDDLKAKVAALEAK